MCVFFRYCAPGKPFGLVDLLMMATANERVFRAIGRSKKLGIYDSWKECKAQTDGFSYTKYRKFCSLKSAKQFINFWRNYSYPVRETKESSGLVSRILHESGRKEKDYSIFYKLFNSEVFKQKNLINDTSKNKDTVCLSALPLGNFACLNGKKTLVNSTDFIEALKSLIDRSQRNQSKLNSHLLESSLSSDSKLHDYTDMLRNSKTLVTSMQETVLKQEIIVNDRNVGHKTKVTDETPAFFNVVESGYILLANSEEVKGFLKKLTQIKGKLNSFEKRVNIHVKELNKTAAEVSLMREEVGDLKETLASFLKSGSLSSSSQDKKLESSSTPGEDDTDSKGPETKRKRSSKSKSFFEYHFTETDIDDLLDSLKPETVDFSTFTVDDDGFVEVYTDGCSLWNGTEDAKAGIGIWFGDNHPLNVAEPACGTATSNAAEIQAARVAIQIAIRAGVKKLKIHTDSEFVINCATKWIHNWKRNGWTGSGGPVKNRKELEKLDLYASKIKVEWEKVLAHSSVEGNEMADRLANEGAAKNER